MPIDQRAALEEVPADAELLVNRADLAAALRDEPPPGLAPDAGEMSGARLLTYLVATVVLTALVAIVWSATN